MTEIWINDAQGGALSLSDRALSYGDGVFATMLARAGKIQFLNTHLRRLEDGAARLGFQWQAGEALQVRLLQVARENPEHCIKLLLSRGAGGRGYSAPETPNPVVLLSVHPLPKHYKVWQQQGITLVKSPIMLGHQPLLAGMKHLNRLEQVLIKSTPFPAGIDDVWVSDLAGNLQESSVGNLLLISGNQVLTPKMSHCGVSGVMRQQVICAMLEMGLNVSVLNIEQSSLYQADHILMTNSLLGAVAVTAVDGYKFSAWKALPRLRNKLF